jgi:hypothetical protein
VKYLLVNHIPAHASSTGPAELTFSPTWLADIRATVDAARRVGADLLLATPRLDTPAAGRNIVPDTFGFEHIPLTGFADATQFLRARQRLAAECQAIGSAVDCVQLDLGGHPVPLGLFADAHIDPTRPRILIVGDTPPHEALRRLNHRRRLDKRLAGTAITARLLRMLDDTLAHAGAIVTSGPDVPGGLSASVRSRVHVIPQADIDDADFLTADQLQSRHQKLLDTTRTIRFVVEGTQTITRGTEHVLQALAKCLRLSARMSLIVAGDGPDTDHFRTVAAGLGVAPHVTWINDPLLASMAADEADVLVDAPLNDGSRRNLSVFVARGLCPIGYAADGTGCVAVRRGDTDALAEAMLRAAVDRPALLSRMYQGVSSLRERSRDAAHRKRLEIARDLVVARRRGAA